MLSSRATLLEGLEVSLRFLRGQPFERLWLDRTRITALPLLAVGNTVTIGIHAIGIGLLRIHSPIAIQIFGPVQQAIVVAVGIIGVRGILGALFELIGQAILVPVLGVCRLLFLLSFLLSLFALRLILLLLLARILTLLLLLALLLLLLFLLLLLSLLGFLVPTPNLIAYELEIELGVLIIRVDLERCLVQLDGFLEPPLSKGRIAQIVERLSSDARILRHRRFRERPIGRLEVPHLIVGAANVESYLRVVRAFHLQVDEALECLVEETRLVGLVGTTRTTTLPCLSVLGLSRFRWPGLCFRQRYLCLEAGPAGRQGGNPKPG